MAKSELFDKKEKFTNYLFNTLREGMLVLDHNLRVERANSCFCNMFQVEAEKTIGEKLYDLGNGQWDMPELRELLERILPEEKVIKDFQVEQTFEKIGDRVMLLNARQIDHAKLILLAIEDATERKKAMQQVKEAKDILEDRVEERTRQVRELASRLTTSEQNERRRLADILHDNLQQKLFSIRMNLDILQRQIGSKDPANPWSEKIVDIIQKTDQALEETRQLSHDLDPSVLNSNRLTEMLKWLKKKFEKMHNFQTDLQADTDFNIPAKEVRVTLLRILRELLFNVVKHAGTDRAIIRVSLSEEDQMLIQVIDEGRGFDVQEVKKEENFGLANIFERLSLMGGNLEMDSAPGRGTRMTVKMPKTDSIIPEKN